MAGKGGARLGAGRPRGSKSFKTRQIADRAAKQGISPLEVQMKSIWKLWEEATDDEGKITNMEKAREACAIAKDAAPYMHPRLQSVEMSADVTVSHEQALDDLE